jgi:hypothetical protein
MLTADNDRSPGVVGFGARDNFSLIFPLISTDSSGNQSSGCNRAIWADHTDLRPTLMTLLCLSDNYTHEGRALVEGLNNSALPNGARDVREQVAELGRTFKQINAPVGEFGRDATHVSTEAISSRDPGEYASLEAQLQALVTRRNALASDIEPQLDTIPGCGRFTQTSKR